MSSADLSVLRVALPLPLARLFDYLPPPGMSTDGSWIGCRVWVPFGPRRLVGFVAATGPRDVSTAELRCVETRIDDQPLLPEELFSNLRWLAEYYHAPLGEVVANALPGPLRQGERLPLSGVRLWSLTNAGRAAVSRLRAGAAPQRLAERLAQAELSEETLLSDPSERPALRSLQRRGWVTSRLSPATASSLTPDDPPALTMAQRDAISAVVGALGGFRSFLLDGVTGSGKTEVYIASIEACLARGRQALVLVPEIGLTPQALQRYGRRLSTPVLALHSGRSDSERTRVWAAMARGEGRVVLGTRSAVFCPLIQPGLIVVDEEHDASYKQQEGVRYHARDFALVRARALGIPALLGSATPSLESMQHVRGGRHVGLRLSARPGAARSPKVNVIDTRRQPMPHGLSTALIDAIGRCLDRGEQALVFRNRRGFAPALLCHDCGWSARCTRCEVAMTLHGRSRLVCHHCGARDVAPASCPECGGLAVVPQGAGTERLEKALAAAFPAFPVVRIDRETTPNSASVAGHFERLGQEPGILVGTQMLAKGHDLGRLTLVAIATVDESLFSADFRASERLAQLLIQVSGRAGRGALPGEVWLQTHHPDHPLLMTLLSGGYHAFVDVALAERRAAGFPPFSHLALLRAETPATLEVSLDFLRVAWKFGRSWEGVEAHTPIPAPMPLRAGRHRAQLLFSAQQRAPLHSCLRDLVPMLSALKQARHVRWSVDVDPVDLY